MTKQIIPEIKNLYDAHELWKTLDRHDGKPGTNGSRSPSDQANYSRAFHDLCLGSFGHQDLARADFSCFATEEVLVLEAVLRGARQRKNQPLSLHYERSLQSWTRALRRDLQSALDLKTHSPKPWKELLEPGPSHLPHFPRKQWPENIREEIEEFVTAFLDPGYMGLGWRVFNKRKMRPATMTTYRGVLGKYIEYCLKVEKLAEVTLIILANQERLETYIAYYLKLKVKGGYTNIFTLCASLATVTRYLAIKKKIDCEYEPYSKDPKAPWSQLYDLGIEIQKQGKRNVVKLKELPILNVADRLELAEKSLVIPPRRKGGTKPMQRQIFIRKRTAIFFALSCWCPVRLENWTMMRWDQHLKFDTDQKRWQVHFDPHEIKNGESGKELRSYDILLPKAANVWLRRWRAVLEAEIGLDFQQKSPWVFPTRHRFLNDAGQPVWKRCANRSFYDGVVGTTLEIRGHAFRTHLVRHGVATELFIGQDITMRDFQQAAWLLGDKVETVIKRYSKPAKQELLDQGYFSQFETPLDDQD